jgi:hypothetical protein
MDSYAISSVLVLFQLKINEDRTLALAQSKWAEAVMRLSCIRRRLVRTPAGTVSILIAVFRVFVGFTLAIDFLY